MSNLMREFPDYDNAELFGVLEIALGKLGFTDASYHHDEMPSFYNDKTEQYVYVNYKDDPIMFTGNVYHPILLVDMSGVHDQNGWMKGYHTAADLLEDMQQ